MTIQLINNKQLGYSPESKLAQERWIKSAFKIRMLVRNRDLIKKAGFTGMLLQEKYWAEKFIKTHPAKDEFSIYMQDWKKNETKFNFEEWLNVKNIKLKTSVVYFSKKQRSEYLISIKDGKFYTRKGDLFDRAYIEKSERDCFIIGADKRLYLFEKRKGHHKLWQQHSSLFSGGAIIGAGMLEVNDKGKIICIRNHSGHYKPNCQNLLDALQFFKNNGINLKGVKIEAESLGIYLCAEKYLQKQGRIKPDKSSIKSKL